MGNASSTSSVLTDNSRGVVDEGTDGKVNYALLIGYQYPPCQQSSGYLRTLAFSRYLPEFGWHPVILTASERAYGRVDTAQAERIPRSVPVVRAFARDARQHFSIRYKYPSIFAVPDRQSSWWLGAVPTGLRLIRRYRPRVLWATQPTPTAFWIALTLHRITGIPWVADFRDPIGLGISPLADRMRRWIERKTVHGCARAVFTTEGAADAYAERYADIPTDRWAVIPNGFDEADFEGLDQSPPPMENRPLRLVHSGLLYPEGRDPRALFHALRALKASNRLTADDLQIILRASGSEEYFQALAEEVGVADMVQLRPALPYRQALSEVCQADGLLVVQGTQFNGQIPAKIYEYFRSGRPIIGITDHKGNTAAALRNGGINTLAAINDADEIKRVVWDFVSDIRAGTARGASSAVIGRHSRKGAARKLGTLLDHVAGIGRFDV